LKLLSIDTSTELASVALLVGDALSRDEQGALKTHAQLVLPMIDRLMVDAGVQMNQLDAIVFGCGPGSFTGLRIACSIAKGLAYAHDLGLIPVSSLGSIAWSARQSGMVDVPVLAVLDARMQEMYWSYFAKNQLVAEERVNPVQAIQVPDEHPIILAGVGIDSYWQDFPQQLKAKVCTKLAVNPCAAAMIQLAQTAALKPICVSKAQPVYVRNQVTHGS